MSDLPPEEVPAIVLARWGAFLDRAFLGDSIEIASYFQVSDRAARKWLDGANGPSASTYLYALTTIAGAAECLLPEGLA